MAAATHPVFEKISAFEPEATHAMVIAFNAICTELNLPATAHNEREILATRVLDLARGGILDPAKLRERVLQEAGIAPES